jgi:hypothetical protein
MSLRKSLLCGLVLGTVLASSSAQAGFVTFVLANPANANEVALVGEQIFAIGGGQLDYEFLVRNIGTVPISGFFGGVGNKAVAIAGGQWVGTAAGGADAANGFPASVAGGFFGPLISGAAGATNPFSPVLFNTWGFEEFDDRVVPAGLPTNYVVRWFDTGFTGPLPVGFFTRFDLFSPFPPTPGGGGVDPPTGEVFFGLEDPALDLFNPLFDSGSLDIQSCTPTGPSDPACGNAAATPGGFDGSQAFGTPEPSTILLMGGGFLAFALLRHRK